MTENSQLYEYKMWLSSTGNTGILISNSEKYYEILRDAFQEYRFGPMWPDQRDVYEYGFHINRIGEEDRSKVIKLLTLFKKHIYIHDVLNQTFALDMHRIPNNEGGGRTEVGELVYHAKPYRRAVTESNKRYAIEIAKLMAVFISSHPSYNRSDLLIPVPFFGQKAFDLPRFLADNICPIVEIENGHGKVRKTKKAEMKNAASEEEKFNIIRGAFEIVDKGAFEGKRVIIIDDIYQSGNTLHELASVLQDAGAEVLGLVATKTLRTFNQDIQR
jgi:hypothetical protein